MSNLAIFSFKIRMKRNTMATSFLLTATEKFGEMIVRMGHHVLENMPLPRRGGDGG